MLDDLIFDKIYSCICKIISYKIKPDIIIENVTDLSIDVLYKLKENNIKVLIVDVDDTLRFNMKPLDNIIIEWLRITNNIIKIVDVSNGYDINIEKCLNELKIPYYKLANKPLKYKLKQILSDLDVIGENTMFIGDDYFTDILSGYRMKASTCLVKKYEISRKKSV